MTRRLAPACALVLGLLAPDRGEASGFARAGATALNLAQEAGSAESQHLPEESGDRMDEDDDERALAGACHPQPSPYRSVVTQSRAPRSAGEEVIDAQAIALAPRRRSADDLLRLVPGVWLSQHGAEGKGQQIFLRGFDAAHGTDVAISVAGIPVNELSNLHGHGYVDLNFVIPELVRLPRGSAAGKPGSAVYGPTF